MQLVRVKRLMRLYSDSAYNKLVQDVCCLSYLFVGTFHWETNMKCLQRVLMFFSIYANVLESRDGPTYLRLNLSIRSFI